MDIISLHASNLHIIYNIKNNKNKPKLIQMKSPPHVFHSTKNVNDWQGITPK